MQRLAIRQQAVSGIPYANTAVYGDTGFVSETCCPRSKASSVASPASTHGAPTRGHARMRALIGGSSFIDDSEVSEGDMEASSLLRLVSGFGNLYSFTLASTMCLAALVLVGEVERDGWREGTLERESEPGMNI